MAVAVVVTTLTACVSGTPRVGQTIADAEKQFTQLIGVDRARATLLRSMDGFTERVSLRLEVRLKDGFEILEARTLADYFLRSLWSIRDARPTRLVVNMASSDGTALDISQGARDSGWDPIGGPPDEPLLLIYQLGEEPTKSKLGAWPGGIPSPPVGAIAPRDDAGTTKSSDQ